MIIGILKETSPEETRIAATPQTAVSFQKAGFDVWIEQSAGIKAGFEDNLFKQSGAQIKKDKKEILKNADIILKINAPDKEETTLYKQKATLIGNLQNLSQPVIESLKTKHAACFALEKMPRLSRAQPFDILSSQNNLAGYQAVIKAASLAKNIFPMMITSAGTLPPLKVLVIGIGVAGLQAVATAKRLGAKVYAYDIREEAKEQSQSLGAVFIENIKSFLPETNILITSAFSTGKKAPLLIKKADIDLMPAGAVLIDMAAEFGGNIEGSLNGKTILYQSKLIDGNSRLETEIPTSASILFANNLLNFVMFLTSNATDKISVDMTDPILKETCIMKG